MPADSLPVQFGPVVRLPGHGLPFPLPALLPNPHRLGASARCRRRSAAGALPRSRGPHQRSAALRAPRRGPDPGLESADRARVSGPGADALIPRHPCGAGPSGLGPHSVIFHG